MVTIYKEGCSSIEITDDELIYITACVGRGTNGRISLYEKLRGMLSPIQEHEVDVYYDKIGFTPKSNYSPLTREELSNG